MLELYPDRDRSFLGQNSSDSDSDESRDESSGGTPEIKTVDEHKEVIPFNK